MLYDISEVCRIFGMTPSGVRYYEEQGLIHPQRTTGGRRKYGFEEMRRLTHIKSQRVLGFSLAEIKSSFLNDTPQSVADVRENLCQRLAELENEIAILQESRRFLQSYIACFGNEGMGILDASETALPPGYMLFLQPLWGRGEAEQRALGKWMASLPAVSKITEYRWSGHAPHSVREGFFVRQEDAGRLRLPLLERAEAVEEAAGVEMTYHGVLQGQRYFSDQELSEFADRARLFHPDWRDLQICECYLFGSIRQEQKRKYCNVWVRPL